MADFSKLNVAQLKALCKEKGFSGYSKLNRQALVEKLSASAPSAANAASSSSQPPTAEPEANARGAGSICPDVPSGNPSGTSPNPSSSKTLPAPSSPKIIPNPPLPNPPLPKTPAGDAHTPASSAAATHATNPTIAAAASTFSTRPQPEIPPKNTFKTPPVPFTATSRVSSDKHTNTNNILNKKRPHDAAFSANTNTTASASSTSSSSQRPTARPAPFSPIVPTTQSVERPRKRFKPLTVSRAAPDEPRAPYTTPRPPTAKTSDQASHPALFHLDFPAPPDPPALGTITLPPSMRERPRADRWKIILGGLSDAQRRVCARVSRAFRYALYLSANEILAREFAGARLERTRALYPAPTVNWWPYLRARERERAERLRAYEASFLAVFYGGCPVARRLLSSPDNAKQLSVVFRFLQSRLWFALSIGRLSGVGSDPLAWLRPTILDAQELAAGEIWALRTSSGDAFNVLEATGEVVGHPPGTSHVMRADWVDYATGEGRPLAQIVRCAHDAEYERGVGRHWRARMAARGEEGRALCAVAERYALANVVTNSISGSWMSVTDMAHDLPAQPIQTTKNSKKQSLGLFLPAHHHVESVHFTAAKGGALHPALAVVQTPAREHFILRDTGMAVGCEEDGVAGIWQKVLGCDIDGRVEEGGERITLASLSR